MMVQEVREKVFTDYKNLSVKVKKLLAAVTCTNCHLELKPNGEEFINYFISERKKYPRVVWWHEARCVSLEEEKRHALLAYSEENAV